MVIPEIPPQALRKLPSSSSLSAQGEGEWSEARPPMTPSCKEEKQKKSWLLALTKEEFESEVSSCKGVKRSCRSALTKEKPKAWLPHSEKKKQQKRSCLLASTQEKPKREVPHPANKTCLHPWTLAPTVSW